MPKKSTQKPSTIITLTLPENEDATHGGTLLVQRGDLARLHQFTYTRIADLSEIIADALIAFAAVEADPPVIPDCFPFVRPWLSPRTAGRAIERPSRNRDWSPPIASALQDPR